MSTLTAAMPNYNHARFLPRAIESIVHQTRPPDEFLILDDASTDDSVEIIQHYASRHSSIRLICNRENAGVLAAHEQLYRLASGDYLYSGAADDDRYPRFFELAMEMANKYPRAGLVFGKMVIVDGQSGATCGETEVRAWQEPLYAAPERFLSEFLLREPPMQAMTGATIFRRDALAEVGWCRHELGSFADTFAARAIALKYGACYVPQPFHIWRRMPESFSQASSRDLARAYEVIDRAARLMRDAEFREQFPEAYVRSWQRGQRFQVAWNYFLGPSLPPPRPSFLMRNLRRLPRLPALFLLLARQWRQA
jgi:hypothetical protein